MNGERIPLASRKDIDQHFYSGQQASIGDVGTSGVSRRLLHGLTLVSVLISFGCTVYGCVQGKSVGIILPFLIVLAWLVVHFLLLFCASKDHHDFQPPGWFIFVSSGQILIQSLTVIVLTLFKKPT